MAKPHAFYRAMVPPEPLRQLIHSFWVYDGYSPEHVLERVLPTTTVEIVFPLRRQLLFWQDLSGARGECSGPLVFGPHRSAYDVPTEPQGHLVGVHFHPGGAWPLFGIPLEELAERQESFESLLGASVRELTERLESAFDDQARFSLLNAYFLDRYRSFGTPFHPVVAGTLRRLSVPGDSVSIADIVASSGLSHRRFVEIFRREIGLTPRDVRRIGRFHETLERVGRRVGGETSNGARLATEAGFFDQSHWILECKKMSGWAPRELFDARRAGDVLPKDIRGQMLPIPWRGAA